MASSEGSTDNAIAIIGMAGRFPGAANPADFWRNLCRGVESITFFTRDELLASGVEAGLLDDPHYVRANGRLEGIELFDAAFFGYTPREAEVMDPQQRLFLECAWEALEDAGYAPNGCRFPVGVFAGQSFPYYLLYNLLQDRRYKASAGQLQLAIANDKDFLTTHVAYKLNLGGPAVTVQTACSTSLVAVHLACQSLQSGDSDMALAGGAGIRCLRKEGYLYEEGGIASPDGHCRAFDARARGVVPGDGVAVVALKRLADALADGDAVRAAIRGSAINNDGSRKIGYTAPSIDAQAAVIAEALAVAGVGAETIGLIEAHGTGTPLGDPIEAAALVRAFGPVPRRRFCALGSVKSNIGHLDAAAGAAGLIKAVLALESKMLPPSVNFERPNPNLDLDDSPFFVNTALTPWEAGPAPRRAGVTSLGIGGTNVHIILEEAPPAAPPGPARPWQLLALSARTEAALDAATDRLAGHLAKNEGLDLADVAWTLHVGRSHFACRRAVVVRDRDDATATLLAPATERVLTGRARPDEPQVAFLFPGQGTQYLNMAAGLYQSEAVFRERLDQCCELLRPHLGLDLTGLLYPAGGASAAAARRLDCTDVAQPALFAVEYALAELWRSWGVTPRAMIGHSVGEYVAACLAGVLSPADALRLVAARGRLIQALPAGAMLAVPLPEAQVLDLLGPDLSLAAVNAPAQCTVSGPAASVAALAGRLEGRGVECRRLHVSHAFHSLMVEPAVAEFLDEARAVTFGPPRLPYLSNVSGAWVTDAEAQDPGYWARHLRRTVRFSDGLGKLLGQEGWVLLEVGPGRALGTLARQQGAADLRCASSLPHPQSRESDLAHLLGAAGYLWLEGVAVDWRRFYAGQRRRRVPLPTYPFERQRYWVDAPRPSAAATAAATGGVVAAADGAPAARTDGAPAAVPAAAPPAGGADATGHPRPSLPNSYVAPGDDLQRAIAAVWEEVLGICGVGVHDDLFDLGGHSLVAGQIVARLRQAFRVEVPVRSLFEGPTVARLAEVVEDLLIQKIEESPQ